MFSKSILALLLVSLTLAPDWPPERKPGTTPTHEQLQWQRNEFGMFCHFGINTFNDQEWSDGKLSPQSFNPTEFDPDQWAQAAKRCGMKYLIFTAKHHDGFCLWPSAFTDYSVKSSPWRGGKGDAVKEVADACKKAGLKFGFYLSPWDRHEPTYKDSAAYDKHFMNQLRELLTKYGEISEVWFDGAGSDGHAYDWDGYYRLIKQLQPRALTAIAGVADIRWVGNEDGVAPETLENVQEVNGKKYWLPAECDVPIRRGHWFWHPNDESSLFPLEHLVEVYHRSVGHGAGLLLNVAPDRRGKLPDADVARLEQLWNAISKQYDKNLAAKAQKFERGNNKGGELELQLKSSITFDAMSAREDLTRGQHITSYSLDIWDRVAWKPVVDGTTIGNRRLDRFAPYKSDRIRLKYKTDGAAARIEELALSSSI